MCSGLVRHRSMRVLAVLGTWKLSLGLGKCFFGERTKVVSWGDDVSITVQAAHGAVAYDALAALTSPPGPAPPACPLGRAPATGPPPAPGDRPHGGPLPPYRHPQPPPGGGAANDVVRYLINQRAATPGLVVNGSQHASSRLAACKWFHSSSAGDVRTPYGDT